MPITLTPDDQGVTMMGQAVQGGASQQVIAEHLGPLFKGAVTGDNQRTGLVAVGTALFIMRYSLLVSNNALIDNRLVKQFMERCPEHSKRVPCLDLMMLARETVTK